jgi:glutamyl-tRNA synthetase
MEDKGQPAIKVRIAPSPTGHMHIGTARTALFNKLFALHHGGEYCVRIEDTDRQRSHIDNIRLIKEAFSWLGLEPDEGYVLQSENIESHREAADKLLENGHAYEQDGALRFKIGTGHTGWDDLVQGHISFDHKELEDFVILRSDGTPTYHLSVVVDDAVMGITHIIRGDDHINNTPKQILLHKALNNALPQFAHIPLIHGTDGQKLSKRHGAASVQEYHALGYLPQALAHYLMQLSWLPGDAMSPLSIEEAATKFDIRAVKKSAATFDPDKLAALNAVYLKELPNTDLLDLLLEHMNRHGIVPSDAQAARLMKGLSPLKTRAHTLADLAEAASIYVEEPPFTLPPEAQQALLEGKEHLAAVGREIQEEPWDGPLLHEIIKGYVQDNSLKFPEVGKPLRVALTGRLQGPGLADIMLALGKEETLRRLASPSA